MFDMRFIHASDFIEADAHGAPDIRASKETLAPLAKACRQQGIDRVLLDLRDVPIGPVAAFTPAELAAIVDTFHEMGFTYQQRLAVLYAADPHHGARMFAFIGRERGWTVRAFDNYENAVRWLALTEETLAEPGSARPE